MVAFSGKQKGTYNQKHSATRRQ